MKILNPLKPLALSLALVSLTNAQELVKHHFNDGNFFPFEVPKQEQEARVKIVNKRVQTHWDESLYNGTNSGRKAQIKQAGEDHVDEILFTQHIWMGFWLKIHGDYMKDNTNTNAGLMQIWGHSASGSENHMCFLKFDGRNGGALVWQHRYGNTANITNHLVYPNFPKDKFVRVVMHVQLAEKDKGLVQVWVDDELLLNKSNQTIGWGEQNASGMINGTYAFGTSIGQYNYFANAGYDDSYDGDNIWFDGHMEGETRTVTYDSVALYNGADGYSKVDPNGGTGLITTPTPSNQLYHITKRNSTGFAIDSGGTASDGKAVYIWKANANNQNQQWEEIDRGGGYYTYQKANTSFSLDGGRGGANKQDVYLWSTADNNYNQQWQKVAVGSGAYKLIKRNASYAINGGNGGTNGQNINLYDSSNTSQNLNWFLTPINN